MSEELFFKNDEDDEFIDSWLQEAKGVGDSEDLGMATEIRLGNDARNKFGLGFETGGDKGSVVAQKEHNDALMDRIKKRKMAAKEDRKQANKFAEEHGVIEDELEGRAAVTSKILKVQKSAAAVASAVAATGSKKKKQKTNGGEKSATPAGDDKSNNIKSNNIDEAARSTSVGNSSGNNGSSGGDEQTFKRKRPKTRSKQKNIRRDKRDAAFLPEHLKVGSDKYAGRPLTDETKKFMGIPSKR